MEHRTEISQDMATWSPPLASDQMHCPECGCIATSDSVDVGVGLIVRGNFECRCGWEYDADGKMNVAAYEDWFVEYDLD